MFTMSERGAYWYKNGYNPNAMKTLLAAGIPTILLAILPKTFADMGLFDVSWIGNFTWFIGCALGYFFFTLFERLDPQVPTFAGETDGISDGTLDGAAATVGSEPPAISAEVPVVTEPAP
ncbi:hypothetical protein [Microbacterium telephonicum]|uniref:hypothetical protein n=1 Tax=Microbacterium telephonicum TaxID=1714841 RepID=UPI0018F4B102|nr:hypothetical protein [Microbacterium telephonicum]